MGLAYCSAPANFLPAPVTGQVTGHVRTVRGAAVPGEAGVRGPQSDDVVESTTSRPLQTVGTNCEADPRERKLEMGADPPVLHPGRAPRPPPSPVPSGGVAAAAQ